MNKRLVEEFFARLGQGDLPAAFAMLHEDLAWWSAGDLPFSGLKTKVEFVEAMRAVGALFPAGMQLVPTGIVGEGDRVAVELAGRATTADGRSYENRYHTVMQLADGKIIAANEYHDTQYATRVLLEGQRSAPAAAPPRW